jgi:hypothetical protein
MTGTEASQAATPSGRFLLQASLWALAAPLLLVWALDPRPFPFGGFSEARARAV